MKKSTPRVSNDAVIALRMNRRLSVAEFAEAAGLSVSAVYRIEQGLRHPRMSTIRQMADALDVEMDALLVKRPRKAAS